MKVSREQVAENRRGILEAAARLFRERGLEGVSIAEIMHAANLSHGAFYGHFGSKEELIAAAFDNVLSENNAAMPEDAIAAYAAVYLSAGHRDKRGTGCLFAGLATEAVRASPDVRLTMTEAIRKRIETFSKIAPGDTEAARRRAAIGSWSAMLGAIILARIADDPALSDEVLAGMREWLGDRLDGFGHG